MRPSRQRLFDLVFWVLCFEFDVVRYALFSTGCTVLAVADAAVSVGATVVKTRVNAVVTPVIHTIIVIPSGQTSDRLSY